MRFEFFMALQYLGSEHRAIFDNNQRDNLIRDEK